VSNFPLSNLVLLIFSWDFADGIPQWLQFVATLAQA
jgi:hypothetical protein